MTYSVLARSGHCLAVATASYSLAVGNAVPALAPGVGAVISQAWTNRSLRHHALAGLRRGEGAETAIAALAATDDGWDKRQVALLPLDGSGAVHTGDACTDWAGSIVGEDFVVAGNFLTGPAVLSAMAGQLASIPPAGTLALAQTVVAALQAGEAAGGDSRGKQSASLLVCANGAGDIAPPDLLIDLRVDDSRDPLTELARLLAVWAAG